MKSKSCNIEQHQATKEQQLQHQGIIKQKLEQKRTKSVSNIGKKEHLSFHFKSCLKFFAG